MGWHQEAELNLYVFVANDPLVLITSSIWAIWKLHPWMPVGKTVQVGTWAFGDYNFQIWQRKNESLAEPFNTAMFVHYRTNQQWEAFSLGFQDCYAPKFNLRQTPSGIEVFRGRKQLGTFDTKAANYTRPGQTQRIDEGTTDRPDHWWFRRKS